MSQPLTAVTQLARENHSATVFFLHGLGDSGSGWAPVTADIAKANPHIKFILPNAPYRSITVNGGMSMPGWYDIKALSDTTAMLSLREDEEGLLTSAASVNRLIRDEIDAGISSNRIVIGGFSQGAALALAIGLTSEYPFAGIFGLSGYIPCRNKILKMGTEANKTIPIFLAHGDCDQVVPYKLGQYSSKLLKDNGYSVSFKTYQGMSHSSGIEEIKDLEDFLRQVLPLRTFPELIT
ncbi:hypothetical protein G9A89_007102 [Geosiphon pyriformis]|nr:hypothetical protein G9A89_007102 [Geosiphon pyriformis]